MTHRTRQVADSGQIVRWLSRTSLMASLMLAIGLLVPIASSQSAQPALAKDAVIDSLSQDGTGEPTVTESSTGSDSNDREIATIEHDAELEASDVQRPDVVSGLRDNPETQGLEYPRVNSTSVEAIAPDIAAGEIQFVHGGRREFDRQSKLLLKLPGQEAELQTMKIMDFESLMLHGVESRSAVACNLKLTPEPFVTVQVPIRDLREFVNNNVRAMAQMQKVGRNLYKLTIPSHSPDKVETIRYLSIWNNYATIGPTELLPMPTRIFAPEAAMHVKNTQRSTGAQVSRRESFSAFAEQLLQTNGPTSAATKRLVSLLLKLAERFYAESEQFDAEWKTDYEAQTGQVGVTFSAISNTELHRTLARSKSKISALALLPRFPESILSVRLNHPVEPWDARFLTTVLKSLRQLMDSSLGHNRIDGVKQPRLTAAFDGLEHVISENVDWLSGFVEVVSVGNKYLILAAVDCDSQIIRGVLNGQTLTDDGFRLSAVKSRIGNVSVHTLTVPDRWVVADRKFVIGFESNRVWLAIGGAPNDGLQKMITQSMVPRNEVASNLSVRVAEEFFGVITNPNPGKNALVLTIDSKPGGRRGSAQLHLSTGVLRLLGESLAQWSRDKLK